MSILYVLLLENDKYYVGRTSDFCKRLNDHFNGNGSEWTRLYKVIKPVKVIKNCKPQDEDNITISYMIEYGIENVRGGTFCNIVLSQDTVKILQNMISTRKNTCYNCNKKGHYVTECQEQKNIKENKSQLNSLDTDSNDSKILTHHEVIKISNIVSKEPADDAEEKMLEQKDIAEIIAQKYKDDLVFVSKNECYIYNQELAIWKAKNAHDIHIDVTRMAESALQGVNSNWKVLKRIKQVLFINGVITYLSQLLRNESFESRLNKNNELLPIRSVKCVNLRTGEVVPRTREHMFTKQIAYDLGVKDEKIDNFLLNICVGDKALLDYFKQILGYCLTGDLNPNAFFIFWGSGSNGKSTLVDILSELMGQFADDIQPKVLMDSVKETSKNGHTEHLKAFIGSRMVSVSEFPETCLDAALVKQISGGDNIKMRECGEKSRDNTVKLKSTTKLIIMTNNKPSFSGADKGMLRRFYLMPFKAVFAENPKENEYKRDPELINYIKSPQGMANFLFELVQGAKRYYETKLTELPKCVLQEKLEYIETTSPFNDFLSDYMPAEKDKKFKRKVSDLRNDFVNSLPKGQAKGSTKELLECLKSKNYRTSTNAGVNFVYIKPFIASKEQTEASKRQAEVKLNTRFENLE